MKLKSNVVVGVGETESRTENVGLIGMVGNEEHVRNEGNPGLPSAARNGTIENGGNDEEEEHREDRIEINGTGKTAEGSALTYDEGNTRGRSDVEVGNGSGEEDTIGT